MTNQTTLKEELKAEWEARAEDWINLIQDTESSHREAMLDGWMLETWLLSGLDDDPAAIPDLDAQVMVVE